jgi:hypothetical protein
MDRMIWLAWRAFWVALGATLVLVGQTLLAPPAPAETARPAPAIEAAPHAVSVTSLPRS